MIKYLTACLSPALCFAVLIAVSPALAQSSGQLETMQPPVAEEDLVLSGDDGMRVIHVSDRLARMPEAVAALQAYHEAKALGLLPVAKTAVPYEIGSEREFNVLTNLGSGITTTWETLTFTLVDESDLVNLWLANDQQGVASEEELAQITAYLLSETPEESWRPEKGLVENNKDIFGEHPDSPDADDRVNVLLFDIEEGSDDCCILGYVTAQDLDPDPAPGRGNAANVLYVDLPDGLRRGVPSLGGTIVHEHQHLIHNAYQSGGRELTFINEGLSEWTELLNGFPPRSIRYLNNPIEMRVRLLSWSGNAAIVRVVADYERAGLFTTYIADRIGREATGSIVQAKCPSGVNYCPPGAWLTGVFGYDLILGEHNLTTAEIVEDFHTTNFVNDAGVDAKYAYESPFRQGLRAVSTVTVDTEADTAPSETTVNVSSGAVEYLTWENAKDLALDIKDFEDRGDEVGPGGTDTRIAGGASNRSNLSLRLFTETDAGAKQLVDLDPETQTHTVSGEYARVTLIVANTRASASSSAASIKLDITGNWGGVAFDVTTVSYETGRNQDRVFLAGDSTDVMAQLYDVPDKARLAAVFVAPLYDNQYTNRTAPIGAPRDFTLKVWNVGDEGFPGDELYSMDVDESPNASHFDFRSGTYSFLRVNLPADEEALSTLPERVFIGLANKGADINYLSQALARARSTVQDTLAYLYATIPNQDGELVTGWRAMANLRVCEERDDSDNCIDWFSLAGQVYPIRARFLTSLITSTDDPVELPSDVRLAQNYPNPFNPSTSISWTQPVSDRVRLSVYNLLGQNMTTLVDGLRPAGEHEVRLDASGWASGVYVYVLKTGAHTLTRHMVLLK